MTTEQILTEWQRVADAAMPIPGSTSRGLPSRNEEMLLLTARTSMPRLIAALRVAMKEINLINPGCDALDAIQVILKGKETA